VAPAWALLLDPESGARGDHRRVAGLDDRDDLGVGDPLEIAGCHAEVGVPRLTLNDVERDAFVGSSTGCAWQSWSGAKRRRTPALGGHAPRLGEGGVASPGPPAGWAVDHAQQRTDRHRQARVRPHAVDRRDQQPSLGPSGRTAKKGRVEEQRDQPDLVQVAARNLLKTLPPASAGPPWLRGFYDERGARIVTAPMGGILFACPTELFADAPSLARPGARAVDASGSVEEELAPAAVAGDIGAAARLGQLLHATGDDAAAERWLRQAARGGDPAAAYTLGILIDPRGTLAEHDPVRADEALVWFRRAATGGDVFGATTMGIRLHQRGRDDAALPWLEEAVERGADAMAAHTLARIYENRSDLGHAEQWERFAATRGDVRAAYDLGRMLNDRGERDEGIHWLRRATLDPDAVDLLRALGMQQNEKAAETA
jgi:tetratricopeptide (TPR) repeat protein